MYIGIEMKETRVFDRWEPIIAASTVKRFEGFRSAAYLCPAGVPTIGYGHTKGVHIGERISEQEADQLLSSDLERFHRQIKNAIKVPISRGQYIAIMDFTFNLGATSFLSSTLLKLLNNGCQTEAAKQFSYWVYITVNGAKQVSSGLVKRRAYEAKIFTEE